MGNTVTLNVGNSGVVAPMSSEAPSGGGGGGGGSSVLVLLDGALLTSQTTSWSSVWEAECKATLNLGKV